MMINARQELIFRNKSINSNEGYAKFVDKQVAIVRCSDVIYTGLRLEEE